MKKNVVITEVFYMEGSPIEKGPNLKSSRGTFSLLLRRNRRRDETALFGVRDGAGCLAGI